MNERIKQLAIQTITNVHFWNAEKYSYAVGHDELKKFAELIIQECLLAISHTPIESDEIGTMVRCHNQVKQHFGVEE